MSDDLIERLRECAECKSSEAWGRLDGGQDLCIGAALATEAADELARLRAALSDERAHADALAETLDATMLAYSEPDRRFCCNGHMCGCGGSTVREMADHYATEALEAHRARRQG